MGRTLCIGLLSALVICMSMVDAVPYSKYGRTCKDIGCLRDEQCVLESDCTSYSRDQCGTYPTCKKMDKSGGMSCTTKICPPGQYCKTVSGTPTCVNSSPDLAPAQRRPSGGHRRPIKPIRPTPPPRSSSYGHGGRYPSSHGNAIGNRGPARNRGYNNRNGGESVKPEFDGGDERDVHRRQSTGTESHGGTSSDTSPSAPKSNANGSAYGASSGYPSAPVDESRKSHSNPANSAYPAGSGYPTSSGYPLSGSSGYPSSGSSGYPSSGSSGYPSSGSSGYPSSGSSGYPSSGSSGYPSSGNSGYPSSGNSGYPASGNSGYPSSGGSRYPSSGNSGYPSGSENSVRRTSSSNVNAGYPGYPQSGNAYGGYPQGGYNQNGYPQGQYPQNGGYQGQYYPQNPRGGYPQNPPQPKKPSLTEQLTNFAKNLATRVLTQTIADKVSGKH